jgi:hypothetical protein
MTLYFWDASDFDWVRGPMNLAAAKADGITGFSYKFTEATWIKHEHSGEAVARARDAGMEFIGGYHVVRSTSPAEQVDYFLSYLDAAAPWWRDFPGFFLQVDLEIWPYDRVTAATGAEFTRLLQAAQPKAVLLYASRGQYGDQLTGVDAPLWNANYGANPIVHYPDAYPGDGSVRWVSYSGQAPAFLQYGSQLRIGTQPGCDCSAYRGTLDQLRELITGTQSPPQEVDTMKAILVRFADAADPQQIWYCDGQFRRAVPAEWVGTGDGPITNHQVHLSWLLGNLAAGDGPGDGHPGQWDATGTVFVSTGNPDVWGVDVATLGGTAAALTPEQVAQVSGAARDGAASAIDGAMIGSTTISTAH